MANLNLNTQALAWFFSEEGGIRAIQPNGKRVIFHLNNNATETLDADDIKSIQDRFVTMTAGQDVSSWECMAPFSPKTA